MSNQLWEVLKERGAVYECPKDPEGKRLGPLVGYAGTDVNGKHFVGDVYVNMAVAERDPRLLSKFWKTVALYLPHYPTGTIAYCGAPMGGLAFATILALQEGETYCFAEQEVIAGTRDKKLTFSRHDEAIAGKNVFIVEDVMNNFSTTATLIELIKSAGGQVVGIVGILNRSLEVTDTFQGIPVIAAIEKPIMQYSQHDEEVADDIERGNFVLKPKADWPRLKAAMDAAK